MKKIILLFIMVAAAIGAATASPFIDSYTIDRDKLPDAAQQMLSEHFPKAKIGMIKVDRHLLKKTDYDVRLTNGTTIEFSNAGKWKSVMCKSGAVPEALVPKAIRTYVSKNYNGLKIRGIVKKTAGYEITLSDDVVLKFNLLYQFKGAEISDN